MSENPEGKSRERRQTGPLREGDETEETRVSSQGGEGETQQISSRSSKKDESRETKTMKASKEREGRQAPASGQAGGYFEAMEERDHRLREIYGGIDWLASFLGFVFALVAAVVLSGIAGLVLIPLGFSPDFSTDTLGPAAITALVVIGVVILLTYFFGGYVSGRLARFDGGLNGVMLVLWTLLIGLLVVLAGGILSSFLPVSFAEQLRNVVQGGLLPTFNNLVGMGVLGIGILAGAFVLAILGSFLGGRTGSRYHTDIDYTL
jgi:hypothetical protein